MTGSGPVEPTVTRRRILIADDHPVVCQGLTHLVAQEPDLEVCGRADNVSDAMQKVEAMRPDLVVVDLSLKDSNGLELIAKLRGMTCSTKVLVWSMFDEIVFGERALRAGASGYVNKQEPVETLLDAIRQVLAGNIYLSPGMSNYLGRATGKTPPLGEDPVNGLSDRELEIFGMIGRSMTTQEIAAKLELSVKTIETHRERIKMKLSLRNAAELTRHAILWVLENG